MNPLLIYICRSYDDYKAYSLQSIPFDKYFITCGFEVNSYDERDNYSFLNINLEKDVDYIKNTDGSETIIHSPKDIISLEIKNTNKKLFINHILY